MADIYAETVRKMSDYILSRLDGSNDECMRIVRDTNPSRYIIIGSLANIIEKGSVKKTSVQDNAITLKFKLKESMDIPIQLSYSIFCKDDLTPEEIVQSTAKSAWNRVDFKESFILSDCNEVHKLLFYNPVISIDNYDVFVDYSKEVVDDEIQITICIHNESISERADKYVFNTKMEIGISRKDIIQYRYEYYYEGLKKYFNHNFRAINCTADFNDEGMAIVTSPYPIFEQNKIRLKDSDEGFIFSFDSLSSDTLIVKLRDYQKILDRYLSMYMNLKPTDLEYNEYHETLKIFNEICERYNEGVDLIESDPNVQLAFKLMNETFKKSSVHDAWRMFQIVYIVSSLPSIVYDEKRGDVCDIIHIPTGGGKTEAYLGVVIFTMFFVRLIGKSSGVAAIVKFPLRMLSVQQVERVANKIIIAEKIRKERTIPGEKFSVAFFVGNSDEFPNHTKVAIDHIRNASPDSLCGKILTKCPLCGGKIVLRETKESSIVHHCLNCDEDHHLYYTDEEIYRYLPTVIISTVDKFSTVCWNRYVKNIFGSELCKCKQGHGYYPSGDECICSDKCSSSPVDMKTIVSPIVIVQDELHLIRESFGSINAHFESFCDELQYTLSGTIPKRIAMTATITGSQEQINQLYGKKAKVFPGPNPFSVVHKGKINNPFFEEEYNGGMPTLHRRIIGLKPNGRDNQYATNLSIKYAKAFVDKLSKNQIIFDPKFAVTDDVAKTLASLFCRVLTYHNKKSDVYSTNHFMDAVLDQSSSSVMKKMLTSDNSTDELRSVMNSIHNFERSSEKEMHVTSATSIVSHGVDIEQWNFMEFQGIPNNTAEYIQAMSRVGRKYSALIFIWFYPNRVRDVSFYHNFQEYHEIIDHKVEPVSINRWTKLSFYETCTSIFSATILNYMSAKHHTKIYNRDHIINFFGGEDHLEHKNEVVEFMHKVYHTSQSKDGAKEIRNEIESIVEERIKIILNSPRNDPGKSFFPNIITSQADKYFGMQLGMRGIQDTVVFIEDSSSKAYQHRVEK